MSVHLQHVHRKRGNQRSRQHVRGEHREHDRFGEWNKQVPRDPAEEEHGDKDDADAERRDQRGHGDLCRAFHDRGPQISSLLQKPLDILDRDRRIIHQDTDRQRQAAEGHDVDGLVQCAEYAHRSENRKRDGDGDDHRAAPASQKDQDHDAGEACRDDRLPDNAADRSADEYALISDRLHPEFGRQRRGYARQQARTPETTSSVDALPSSER